MEIAYTARNKHTANNIPTSDCLFAMAVSAAQNQGMRKKTPYLYAGEVRKSVNMPPALWHQIEERLKCYEPELAFADWVRRIAQDELKRPVRPLGDWLAQPKDHQLNHRM